MRLFDLFEASPLDNPAFLRWFAGSKVVDAQGQPLKVYHGTALEFDAFSGVSHGIDGIYFSSAPSIADQYADYNQGEGEGGNLVPVYLRIKNPLVVDYRAYLKKFNNGEFADERDARGEFASEVVNDIVDSAKDFGRDGVILHGIRDGWTDNSELATTYIVFSPNQIKSVFNKGTWNPNTPKLSESVDSPEFRRWFGNSKIVDRRGQPLPVHHGTAIPKTQFRPSRGGDMHGIYFTPDHEIAQAHADMDSEIDGDDPLIISVYLSIQNPLIVSQGIVDDPRVTGKWTAGKMDYQQLTTEMLNLIVADGYDGIVITDGAVEDATEIVAFYPNQVKSVDNRGGWNPETQQIHEAANTSFNQWFGNSFIRNPDGSPKVMYHWGPKGITKFRGMPTSGWLIYWNEESSAARDAARNSEQEYRAYIRCENPYGSPDRPVAWYTAEANADRIKQDGYDGIYVKDEGGVSLAVFDPDQIRLVNSIREAILNELRIIKDTGATDERVSVVAFRGRVWLLPWLLNGADENVLTDMAFHLGLNMEDWQGDVELMADSIDDIVDERPDIIYGYIQDNDFHLLNRSGVSTVSPMTSPMIAKLVRQLGLSGASYGYFTNDGDDDTAYVHSGQIRGKLPERLYHGTSSDYMQSIARTGIRPGLSSNWASQGIEHKSIVFGAVAIDGAIFHANNTAGTNNAHEYGVFGGGETFPVILEFAIPDPDQLVPDYDVAAELIGDEHPISTRLGYTGQDGGNFNRMLNTMVADQNPEGRAWKSTAIFGYVGRIPPKYITRVYTDWNPDEAMTTPEWNGTLQEYLQEWTARYEYDGDEQDDENY